MAGNKGKLVRDNQADPASGVSFADATSAVDPAVEARILDALRTSGTPTTVVVVAYRQATIALADEVVWLEDGRAVARGTHEELLADVPGYAALVRAYAQAEVPA